MTDTTEQPQNQDGDHKPEVDGSEIATMESPEEAVSPESTGVAKAAEQEVYLSLDELDDDNEYSQEEFNEMLDLYDQTMVDFVEGELVVGKILAVNDKEVSVDIGFKSEGVIPIEEFKTPSEITVGDDIEVFLDDVEDSDGQLVLSKRKADFMRQWEKVVQAYESDDILEGVCMRRIRGGIVVDLFGVDAFLPGSQIDVKPIRDFDALIGKTMEFKIVKVNELRKNIVVSHRVLIEEGMKEQRQQILENLEKGQILEGSVKNITDFGVFIDLGGVDGLLHINDLSWGRVGHPSEIVALDAKIKIQILDFNEEKDRISLGYKQLQPHPWDNIKDKYTEGDVINGRVVNIADYGAFIELEKGVEGLIHISEMSWTQHIKHPSKIVSLGETVEAKILSLDHDGRKISLGLKQLEPDPWEDIEEKYPVNSRQSGVVRNLTNFGAFVELEEGIDGLIHISDLSWTKKIRHPGEVVKKGDEVEIMVLNIDKGNRRISLGFKQIQDNPWDRFADVYSPQKMTKANIVRMIEKGVIVELPDSVDGFVPMSQLQQQGIRRPSDGYKVGDELELMVIEFNKESKKIILSEKSAHDKSVSDAGLALDDHEAIAEFEKEAGIKKKAAAKARDDSEAREPVAAKSQTEADGEAPASEQKTNDAVAAQPGQAEAEEKSDATAKVEATAEVDPVAKAEVSTPVAEAITEPAAEKAEAVEAPSAETETEVEEPAVKETEETGTAEVTEEVDPVAKAEVSTPVAEAVTEPAAEEAEAVEAPSAETETEVEEPVVKETEETATAEATEAADALVEAEVDESKQEDEAESVVAEKSDEAEAVSEVDEAAEAEPDESEADADKKKK